MNNRLSDHMKLLLVVQCCWLSLCNQYHCLTVIAQNTDQSFQFVFIAETFVARPKVNGNFQQNILHDVNIFMCDKVTTFNKSDIKVKPPWSLSWERLKAWVHWGKQWWM